MMGGEQMRLFGLRDRTGHLFGNFGSDFTFIFTSTFLIAFYMKVLGISGAAVETLFLVARIVDAFRNVTMGRIVGMCGSGKDGRFRQWIRRMAGPAAIASFLMYQPSLAGASMAVKIVYTYVTCLLRGSICYTATNIPCSSMASAITDRLDEHTGSSTSRGVGTNLTQLVIGVLGPAIIYATDGNGAQVIRNNGRIFLVVAVTFSLCAIACYVIYYEYAAERVKIDKNPDAPEIILAKTFKIIFSSRAMLGIIGAALFLILNQLLISGLNSYLYAGYFGDIKAFSSYTFINIMLSLILTALVGSVTRRVGKKEATVAATVFTDAAYLVLFFLKLTNPWVCMIPAAIGSPDVNSFNLVIWASITDVIDGVRIVTGKREDGTICSAYLLAKKVGQALAGGLSGYALETIGYQSADKVWNPQVSNGLYTISILVSVPLSLCITIMLLVVYPLNKKKVEENSLVLRKRRTEK